MHPYVGAHRDLRGADEEDLGFTCAGPLHHRLPRQCRHKLHAARLVNAGVPKFDAFAHKQHLQPRREGAVDEMSTARLCCWLGASTYFITPMKTWR